MYFKFLLVFLCLLHSFLSFSTEIYRDYMRELLLELKKNTSPEKIFITQNGNELYYKNGKLDENMCSLTQGTTQESLFYGYELKLNTKTSSQQQKELLKYLLPLEQKKKRIFHINYGKGEEKRKQIQKSNLSLHFLGELLPSLEANSIYEPIEAFHPKEVKTLNKAKNFLCLLNPEHFNSLEEYYQSLEATDYDILFIEPSFQGVFFTKEQIRNLKYKSSGQRRLVIAYFSIGEAENYRYYWQENWNQKKPKWIIQENPNWKGNYIVEYWNPEWKKIIKEYQKKLDKISVDGYLLDTVDTFYYFEELYEKKKNKRK